MQTYSRHRFGADGPLGPEEGVPTLIMGYEFWPEALEATIRYAARRRGCRSTSPRTASAPPTTTERLEYVRRALRGVVQCLRDGIDVRGYFYWSLLDNFEWLFGYGPPFGLIARRPRHAARTSSRAQPGSATSRAPTPWISSD